VGAVSADIACAFALASLADFATSAGTGATGVTATSASGRFSTADLANFFLMTDIMNASRWHGAGATSSICVLGVRVSSPAV